jgi:hypothetical protein
MNTIYGETTRSLLRERSFVATPVSPPTSISYNTFDRASLAGPDAFPLLLTIEYNDFIGNETNLKLHDALYEPSDVWPQELFEKGIIKSLRTQVIQASNNYWGSSSKEEVVNNPPASWGAS